MSGCTHTEFSYFGAGVYRCAECGDIVQPPKIVPSTPPSATGGAPDAIARLREIRSKVGAAFGYPMADLLMAVDEVLSSHSAAASQGSARCAETDMRLADIAKLGPNWDSYGAQPIDQRAIEKAQRVIAVMAHPPQIVPTSHSGVQLEWHRDGIDVEIVVRDDGYMMEFYSEEPPTRSPRSEEGRTPATPETQNATKRNGPAGEGEAEELTR